MDTMETLMDVSLETTGTCLEKIEAIRGAVETRQEACLEEAAVIIGATEDRTRGRVIPGIISRHVYFFLDAVPR